VLPYDKKKFEEDLKKRIPGYSSAEVSTVRRNFSKNLNDVLDLTYDNCLEKLSCEDWTILFETDEEFYRRGHFERIFPIPDAEKMDYYA
jgi:tubulin polyglutamylase TTLL4